MIKTLSELVKERKDRWVQSIQDQKDIVELRHREDNTVDLIDRLFTLLALTNESRQRIAYRLYEKYT